MSQLDCEHVLQLVWGYLDGEVSEDQYLGIQMHIARCADCGPRYAFQRRLLALVEQKCKEGPIPVSLKQRLFRLLEE